MLATSVAGLKLPCCVYNASGPRTQSIEALEKIGESKSGAILSKSTTLEKQTGNPLPRFVQKIDLGPGVCEGSINSEGLPNEGIDYCKKAGINITESGRIVFSHKSSSLPSAPTQSLRPKASSPCPASASPTLSRSQACP